MVVKDKENEDLQREFEHRDAGVSDLMEFYARVEKVYVSASQALQCAPTATASTSTHTG